MMTKKFLAPLLAAVMMISVDTTFAGESTQERVTEAEAVPMQVLNFEDMDPELYEGAWVSFGSFNVFQPEAWEEVDLSKVEGAEEAGTVYSAFDPEKGWSYVVAAAAVPEDTTAESTLEDLKKAKSYDEVTPVALNSLNAVRFDYNAAGTVTRGVAFLSGDHTVRYTVMVSPYNDEDFAPIADGILQSVSPATESVTEVDSEDESEYGIEYESEGESESEWGYSVDE